MANNRENNAGIIAEDPTEDDIFNMLIDLFNERCLPTTNLYYFKWRVEEVENVYRKFYRPLPVPEHFNFLQHHHRVPTNDDLLEMVSSCECEQCLKYIDVGR